MTLTLESAPATQPGPPSHRGRPRSLFDPELVVPALAAGVRKLNPVYLLKNPVMFVTEIGAVATTGELFFAHAHGEPVGFVLQVAVWLWFTVLFANFAESLAEGRGKAQADARRKTRTRASARKLDPGRGDEEVFPAESLRKGDLFVCEAN